MVRDLRNNATNQMLRGAACAWLALGLLAAAPSTAGAQVPQIVNGEDTQGFPTTAAVLAGSDPNTALIQCTGTVIGCDTVLTAAHCVCPTNGIDCNAGGAPDPANFKVYLQHAGIFSVDSIAVRSDFDFPTSTGDVSVLRLSTPVVGIRPTPINTTATPPFGSAGTIAGFGLSGTAGVTDWGIKRAGSVTTAICTVVSNTNNICWDFEAPLGLPGSDSNTCNVDSGGPLFVDFGGGDVVAGITSGGISPDCQPPDDSYDADVFFYNSWIQTQSGTLGQSSCGSVGQVGDTGTTVHPFWGDLSAATPQGTHSFSIGTSVDRLVWSLNGWDDGVADFDLYVKRGAPPTTLDFDCKRSASGQFGACVIENPLAGTWHALIQRKSGEGRYQATATVLGNTAVPVFPLTGH